MARITREQLEYWLASGYGYVVNGGEGSTPITFAGAYDADAPDCFISVPDNTGIIPYSIRVIYETVGTESTMEIIALVSDSNDSTATGTAATIKTLRTDAPQSSLCTATVAVDAAGITDPHDVQYHEFWRYMRPLTDTVATTENDRHPLVFSWTAFVDGPPPVIQNGGSLSVYAASQAGTGFITVTWVELPSGALT